MSDVRQDPAPGSGRPGPKTAAPGLDGRAPRPPVVRLRGSVVRAMVIAACLLLAGALAWAFVVQPELRHAARNRTAEAADDRTRRSVRPAEVVTDQPATYDRLPEPRPTVGRAQAPTGGETADPSSGVRSVDRPVAGGGFAAQAPTLRQRAIRSDLFFDVTAAALAPAPVVAAAPPAATPPTPARPTGDAGVSSPHRLTTPLSPFEIKAGVIVPAVLLTGVDTSRPGPVIGAVTQNLYDTVTGRHLLLPQGSRLIGRHEGDSAYGDRRAFLVWDRLILPNGKSLVLEAEPGVDAQGATGVTGRVDRRLGALVTGTLFAGAVTTLGQMARDGRGRSGSLLGDAGDAAAIEGARVGGRLIDRELEVRPAIRIEAGALVRVMITHDLALEPYQP